MLRRLLRKPVTWLALAVLAAGMVFGLYWFQPWKLVVDERVDEPLAVLASPGSPEPSAPEPSAPPPPSPSPPAGPELLAQGDLISHEHPTTGSARIVRNLDGSQVLELVDLDTSNGPDLRVWLTDQPVIEGRDGWHVFDDGAWLELGRLKGNQGNQVYEIPPDVDPAAYSSVSIWCKRFSVSFGAAELSAAPQR
jgi:hypothetical protein